MLRCEQQTIRVSWRSKRAHLENMQSTESATSGGAKLHASICGVQLTAQPYQHLQFHSTESGVRQDERAHAVPRGARHGSVSTASLRTDSWTNQTYGIKLVAIVAAWRAIRTVWARTITTWIATAVDTVIAVPGCDGGSARTITIRTLTTTRSTCYPSLSSKIGIWTTACWVVESCLHGSREWKA